MQQTPHLTKKQLCFFLPSLAYVPPPSMRHMEAIDSALCSSHLASMAGSADVPSIGNNGDTLSDSGAFPSSLSPSVAHLLLQISGWSYYSVWKLSPAHFSPRHRIVWCHGGVNPTVDDYHRLSLILQHYQRRRFLPVPQSRLASMAIQSRKAQWSNSADEFLLECAAASIKALVYVPFHEGEVLELGTTEMIAETEKEATVAQLLELIGAPTDGAYYDSFDSETSNELASSLAEPSPMTHTLYNDFSLRNFGPVIPPSDPCNNYLHPNYITNDLFLQDHMDSHHSNIDSAIPPAFESLSSMGDHDPFSISNLPTLVDNLPSLVDPSHNILDQTHLMPSHYGNVWGTASETKTLEQPSQYPSSKLREETSHGLLASCESGTYSTHYTRLSAFRSWAPLHTGAQLHCASFQSQSSLLKRCLLSWLPKLGKIPLVHLDLCETSRTKSSSTSTFSNFECNNQATTSMQSNDAATQHMIAERRRRKRQREHFTALKTLVPTIKKRDKVTILEHSLHYIQHLKDRVRELEQQQQDMVMMQKKDIHIENNHGIQIGPEFNVHNNLRSILPTQKSNSSVVLHSRGPPCTFALTMTMERKIEDVNETIMEVINCLKMEQLDCIHVEFMTNHTKPCFNILARTKEKLNLALTSSFLSEMEKWWKKLAQKYVVNPNE